MLIRPARLLQLAGIIAAAAIFNYTSAQFHVPSAGKFGGSLLCEPNPIAALAVVALAFFAAVLVSTLLAGSARFDAGLLCAAVGLVAFSTRCGTIGDILRPISLQRGPVIFVHLALELALLYAIAGAAWSVLFYIRHKGFLAHEDSQDRLHDNPPIILKIAALLVQSAATAACLFLLLQTDAKSQVLLSITLASFIGAYLAYAFVPLSPSPWLWVGPLFVGIAGYTYAYLHVDPAALTWRTGQLTFKFSQLARALPIDYAGAGITGALIGYWSSRSSHTRQLEEAQAATEEFVAANDAPR